MKSEYRRGKHPNTGSNPCRIVDMMLASKIDDVWRYQPITKVVMIAKCERQFLMRLARKGSVFRGNMSEIAREMGVRPKCVFDYTRRLLKKFKIYNKQQLLLIAKQLATNSARRVIQ